MGLFQLSEIGGPWGRRLARRRRGSDDLDLRSVAGGLDESDRAAARWVWTQSALSELASAAAFAEIAGALVAAGAPIDLVAAAGEFVTDEIVHAELSGSIAMALGGAVPLEVDLTRLVRPPESAEPLLRAAELLVRTSCIGEALTLPLLKRAEHDSDSPVLRQILARIAREEGPHAELGWWFLDWAEALLDDRGRAHLSHVATLAVASFQPLFGASCARVGGGGVLDCAAYDAAFFRALDQRVVGPLASRGIEVDAAACRS